MTPDALQVGNSNIPGFNLGFNRMLEMTPDARTNAGKNVTSNLACSCSQRYNFF